MQNESTTYNKPASFRQTPEEKKAAYEKLSEDNKKIAGVLDQHLNEDILFFKNGNVLIRLRLGDKVLAEYPLHCEVESDGISIYEYANPKLSKSGEE